MKNGKTLVAAAAAAMLAVPASHAAIDDAGMQYTSAAEGFYGSLRMDFNSSDSSTPGEPDTDSAGLDTSLSRLGVRGTVDLGGGLSAGYNYEFVVNGDQGAAVGNTRLHNVGLSGGFGSLLVGTQWALDYNYVWSRTDVMNVQSGWFYSSAAGSNRAGRQSNAITYTSPDFNGFNFGLSGALDSIKDDAGYKEDAAVDKFVTAAGYSFGGFDIAGTYVRRDTGDINPTSVGLALGYGQDNWSLGYYHAKTDMDTSDNEEELVHSFAGQVGIGKTTLRALYETLSDEGNGVQDIDTDFWTLEAQYDLGSKSRVYAEYNQEERDNPNDPSGSSDETLKSIDKSVFLVGYRVDF